MASALSKFLGAQGGVIQNQRQEQALQADTFNNARGQQQAQLQDKAQGVSDEVNRTKAMFSIGRALKGVQPQQGQSIEDARMQVFTSKFAPIAQKVGIQDGTFTPERMTDQSIDQLISTTSGFLRDPAAMDQFRKTKSSKVFSNGLTIQSTDSGVRVIDPSGQEISGQAAAQAIEQANAQEVEQQTNINRGRSSGGVEGLRDADKAGLEGDIAGSKETEKLEAQTKLAPNLEKQKLFAKDAAALSTELFTKMDGIERNVVNLNKGIELIDRGANTGPIDKWFPSFKDSTVVLDNLKAQLGLDVIGSVTFGALSATELKTAFDTAVPPNLNGPELKAWFQERIDAQQKLFTAMEDAAIFLSEDGATIPKLMASRRQQRNGTIQNNIQTNGSDVMRQAQDAIAKGADRNAVIQRLKDNGIDVSGL